jgi:hypothetical protein
MGELPVLSLSNAMSLECPTQGGPCPARVRLASLYGEQVDASVSNGLAGQLRPELDGVKLTAKLVEHTAQAQARGCEGAQDGSCPTWMAMGSSESRRTAVSGVRKIIKLIGLVGK